VLCNSIMKCGGIMTADKTVKLEPARSLLGYRDSDPIAKRCGPRT
jgi:hypothetical protein